MALRPSHVQQRVPHVHLQHLALHLDGADQDPDLVLVERLRVGGGQVLQLFGHRGVLIRGHLQLQAGALPLSVQRTLIAQRQQTDAETAATRVNFFTLVRGEG